MKEKEQIFFLVELQKIDSEIRRLRDRNLILPKEIARLEEDFQGFGKIVEQERVHFDELNEVHRKKERELKECIENIKKTKNRLLDVKTNREYQAMLKEIEIFNGKNNSIEDEIIVRLDEIDQVKKNLEIKEKELKVHCQRYETAIKSLKKEKDTMDSALHDIEKRIGDVRKRVNPELIKKYDIIKEKRNGLAVVPVWKAICEGCHMNVPPQIYNELQKNEQIHLCPFCNRIIYWDKRDDVE